MLMLYFFIFTFSISILDSLMLYYFQTVCGHVKNLEEDKIDLKLLDQSTPCSDLKPLHSLIKEKFFQLISQSFSSIPTNNEFYFCRSLNIGKRDLKQHDSDDDVSNLSGVEQKFDANSYLERSQILQRLESGFSGISQVHMPDVYPLFLQLICTIRYNNGGDSNVSVRVLPTCLGKTKYKQEVKIIYLFYFKVKLLKTSKLKQNVQIKQDYILVQTYYVSHFLVESRM